ncbi:hypothetical protein ACFW91_25155 [Streptomyces asoensis]|uniref:hypothetical protein n=1 Tax=Streptomyces asoensis TaxID=249586 RepID=UPI0036C243EF
MEQATQATTPTASTQDRQHPAPGSFEHASALAAATFAPLTVKPFAVEIAEDFPSGWRIHFKYRDSRAAGLFEFAAAVDVAVTRADTAFGVHLDAIARCEGLELHASALTSCAQADDLQDGITATPAAVQPVALGASVLAQVPVITPVGVEPPPEDEDDAEDVARCVRCGCTEDAACEGGCVWIPNRMLVDLCSSCATADEMAGVAHMIAVSQAIGDGQ